MQTASPSSVATSTRVVSMSLPATLTIDKVRVRDSADIIGASVVIRTLDDEPVATAAATFFHSREAAA